MLIDTYKRYQLNIEDIYFSERIIPSRADLTRYIQCIKKHPSSKKFTTNILSLDLSDTQIKKDFRKSVRSEINQAIKKHSVQCEIFYKPNDLKIDQFCQFFDGIASVKKINRSNITKLKRMKKNIIISEAYFEEKRVVSHLYIFDKNKIRLLYSCSKQSNAYEIIKIISKANKLLHFEDIKFAILKRFSVYDFGGISLKDNKVAGIDSFKLGFSKKMDYSYNFIIGNTIKGKIIAFLYKVANKI